MDTQPTPTAVLREEHQLILQVITALERVLDRGHAGGTYDFDAIEKCTTFFRLFADACHHGKEEDLLFPELETRGVPRDGGPIAVMLYEHEQGRSFVRQMRDSLQAARSGDEPGLQRLVDGGRSFIHLLRGHIDKEDNVLFMMADRMFDQPACGQLCERYDSVCRGTFDGQTKEQLQQLAQQLSDVAADG